MRLENTDLEMIPESYTYEETYVGTSAAQFLTEANMYSLPEKEFVTKFLCDFIGVVIVATDNGWCLVNREQAYDIIAEMEIEKEYN